MIKFGGALRDIDISVEPFEAFKWLPNDPLVNLWAKYCI